MGELRICLLVSLSTFPVALLFLVAIVCPIVALATLMVLGRRSDRPEMPPAGA
jgi:hypothetical protein